MPEAHSPIGASSAYRWIACPGSVRLCEEAPEKPSTIYAAAGTVAHHLCELCLLNGTAPESFLGQKIEQGGFDIVVDRQMLDGVSEYVDTVRSVHEREGGTLLVEQSFSLEWLHPGMFGRNDACIVPEQPFGTLYVFDYKNGRTPVEVENNPQLKYYALGALGEHNDLFVENIVVVIVQPNAMNGAPHVREWKISVHELYTWAYGELLTAAKRTAEKDAPLVSGDHCGFCAAASVCPVRLNAALALLDPAPAEKVASLPPVASIPPERVGKLSAFFNSSEFKVWQKALAETEYDLLSKGVEVPGRKLIQKNVKGNRKWGEEAAVLKALGAYGEAIFDSKLKSPAQMEKALSAFMDKKEAKAKVAELTTRDESIEFIVVSEAAQGEAASDTVKEAINLF